MEQTGFDGIAFADTLQDFNTLHYAGQIVHILCCDGSMGFTFQDTRYDISVNDYVILPNAELGSGFSASNDFRGILMSLSEAFVASIAIRSNYGIIGHLSLLQNPVMKLSARDFRICEAALRYLRMRMEEKEYLFRDGQSADRTYPRPLRHPCPLPERIVTVGAHRLAVEELYRTAVQR